MAVRKNMRKSIRRGGGYGVKRSPKVGINQLSSMEFRGLASDCVCNHRTPPSSV